jgi:hypothetical protein
MWAPGNEDNLDVLFQRFGDRRSADLHHRFSGWYRAIVEETNDPLNIRRVRVRIPELHDIDTEVEMLPWAIAAPWHGGTNAGSFANPAIKDIVYICYEKNHPYVPIYCAAPDSTRRRAYPLWSTYTKTPLAVKENGDPDKQPEDFLKDYLPKDNRPMNMGFTDRYGHYLLFNSHGFFPSTHKTDPIPAGTDAISKKDFQVSKEQPKVNEPDLKYMAFGTKYGHTAILADQGYKWDEEFDGDFEKDESFEIDRYKYLIKYYNEQKEKERDQRRMEFRTRLGHKWEMRDVGWDKSRSGEYGAQKTIGDSKGRDERWIKWRTKGGHLLQALDKGFEPDSDNFYKRLNKSEMGVDPDKEDQLGDDSRMIRFITRHGCQLILDDRGTSPTSGEDKTPDGNGVLLRTRKGYQLQMCDKVELDHIMFTTPKNQCFEINDRHDHIIISTAQSDELHTEVENEEIKSQPPWVHKTGISNDPESNTCHLKLDKVNDYCRLKVPDGAGFEVRGKKAPCGQWTESRDSENRAVWMSVIDQWLLIRNKTGELYIVLDDNDDALMIRNEKGRMVIHAKKDIHIKSDEGNICFEAPKGQIGMKALSIECETNGASHKFDGTGFGTSKKIQGQTLAGTHDAIQIPAHPVSPAPPAPKPGMPCKFKEKIIARKKPDDFDKERGCDPQKPQKGPVPPSVTDGGSGGGGGGAGSGGSGGGGSGGGAPPPGFPPNPNSDPPPTSPFVPTQPGALPPVTPPPVPDPIEEANPGGGGVLWYGLSAKFQDEVEELGLLLESFTNHLNIPPAQDADRIHLARSLEIARGKKQAILSQERYSDVQLILRIRNVPNPDLLKPVEGDDDLMMYPENIPFEGHIEVFEVGEDELTVPPLFPNV